METFGIFCLFVILMTVVIGIPWVFYILQENPESDGKSDGNSFGMFSLLVIEIVVLYYLYSVFHHGLWMLLRGR